jgi:hypothetical protein
MSDLFPNKVHQLVTNLRVYVMMCFTLAVTLSSPDYRFFLI